MSRRGDRRRPGASTPVRTSGRLPPGLHAEARERRSGFTWNLDDPPRCISVERRGQEEGQRTSRGAARWPRVGRGHVGRSPLGESFLLVGAPRPVDRFLWPFHVERSSPQCSRHLPHCRSPSNCLKGCHAHGHTASPRLDLRFSPGPWSAVRRSTRGTAACRAVSRGTLTHRPRAPAPASTSSVCPPAVSPTRTPRVRGWASAPPRAVQCRPAEHRPDRNVPRLFHVERSDHRPCSLRSAGRHPQMQPAHLHLLDDGLAPGTPGLKR